VKIQFYTFSVWNNTSFKIAKLLQQQGEEVKLLMPQFSFHRMSELPKDTYFLGFGEYTRIAKRMRIEQLAQNVLGKKILIPGREEMLPLYRNFVVPNDTVSFSQAQTNGPCNRAAYYFASQFGSDHSAFLHIPHLYDKQKAIEVLLDLKQQWETQLLTER